MLDLLNLVILAQSAQINPLFIVPVESVRTDLLLVVHSVPLVHPLKFCDLFILGDSRGIVQNRLTSGGMMDIGF